MSLGIRKPYICTSITNKHHNTTCTVHMHVDMQKCVIEHVRLNRATDQFGLNNFLAMPCYYNVSRLWCTLHMWHTRDAIYIIVIFVHEKRAIINCKRLTIKMAWQVTAIHVHVHMHVSLSILFTLIYFNL